MRSSFPLGVIGIASSQTKNVGTIFRGNCRSSAARTFSVAGTSPDVATRYAVRRRTAGGVLMKRDSRGGDPRQRQQSALDLSWLNADAINLDLVVDSTQELELAVWRQRTRSPVR